ncbi:hypothetical protein CHS0354_028622 [Potamilus streckersoni]|uniref:Uncharacterized protein n=1 Tax=Potamilus streckersoni TaxID=2493646 RepID=A0AAE0VJL5_9BIVA|nr:hypothetical protein CHS0354_028622 [Potamilus streckersoni]
MGSNNSHEQATPERRDCHARLLGIDPRSPTENINRTPIIVLKTPDDVIDPRSPTCGIIRTPIILDKVIEQEGDPRSPTPGIERTPLSNILPVTEIVEAKEIVEHSTLTSQLVTEVDSMVCSSVEVDTHEPVMIENSENTPDTKNESSLQNMSLVEGTIQVLANPPLPSFSGKSSSNKENSTQRKKSRATQPKELFPKQRVAVSFNKDSIRSPLSTRTLDMNSPRQIVQWNQSKKVENARSCQIESVNSRFIANDKENNYFG